MGGHYQRIIAVGGITLGRQDLKIIEEWNEGNGTWFVNPTKSQTARHLFGAVAVPQSIICWLLNWEKLLTPQLFEIN